MLTKEMQQWLTDNRETYEFYLMHAAFHDPLWRMKMMNTPVTPDDFWREEYALVMGGLIYAQQILSGLGQEVPAPPGEEFMKTYISVAARQLGAERDAVDGALRLVTSLGDPRYREHHYCVAPYFPAWFSSRRAKRVVKEFVKVDIPDVAAQVALMQQQLDAANAAAGVS